MELGTHEEPVLCWSEFKLVQPGYLCTELQDSINPKKPVMELERWVGLALPQQKSGKIQHLTVK